MSFLSLAQNRYTTKKYDPTKKVDEAAIEELKQILRLSPSSINSQPWKFVFVNDENVKNQLAAASYFNEQRTRDASHLVVFNAIDDVALFEQQIKENLPQGSIDYYHTFIKPQSEAEIKAWLQHQVYLALGFFLSACATMGIDSTPMEGIKSDEYKAILQLDGYKPLFAVAIGYRDAEDANQPAKKPKLRVAESTSIMVIEPQRETVS